MNRRKFMKVLLGCSAAAALPVVGKAVSNKPVIAFDPAKPGADETGMTIGRYESARFVSTKAYLESTPSGESVWTINRLDGGYDFSPELLDELSAAKT